MVKMKNEEMKRELIFWKCAAFICFMFAFIFFVIMFFTFPQPTHTEKEQSSPWWNASYTSKVCQRQVITRYIDFGTNELITSNSYIETLPCKDFMDWEKVR